MGQVLAGLADDHVMVSAAQLLDRGRLLLGLLLVIPLGAIIASPSPRSGDSRQRPSDRTLQAGVWQVGHGETGGSDHAAPAEAVDPEAILARLSQNSPQPIAAPAEQTDGGTFTALPTEHETSLTTVAPSGYIPGSLAGQAGGGTTAEAAAIALARHPNVHFTRQSQVTDLATGQVDPRVVDLLTWIANSRQITITSMRTDHSTYVAGTRRVSAHHLGRAFDIGAVNGEICRGVPGAQCGRLYEDIVNQLRGSAYQPSQVIYGYDPWPGESWNFEMSNHHDHIHVGY